MSSAFKAHPDRYCLQIFASRCESPSDLWPFVDLLEELALASDELVPVRGRKTKFSRDQLSKLFATEARGSLRFSLQRNTAPAVAFALAIDRTSNERGMGSDRGNRDLRDRMGARGDP